MLRLAYHKVFKPLALSYKPRNTISNWKIPSFQIDSAGISGFLDCRNEVYLNLSQKLGEVKPLSLYTGLDEWTRELLVTLSVDLNCGFATSIILATIAIKTVFLVPTLKAQLMGLRQAEIKSLSENYREKMKVAQMTQNSMLMSQASYQYKLALKKKGINNMLPMVNLLQVPFLITWFLSLRYMSNLPEIYPQILTEGYLWFVDLSTYDPYFVLPVLAACVTSVSIARSPNLARNNISMPFLIPYMKYVKYLPFVSLAFTSFFPASINLYWLTLAFYQLFITQLMYSKTVRRLFGGQSNEKRTRYIIDAAVLVGQQKTSDQVMKTAQIEKDKRQKNQEERDEIESKISQARENIKKAKASTLKEMEINDVKVSLKKPKKKKEKEREQ